MNQSTKKLFHVPKSKVGSGDAYGSGVRQKVGTVVRSYLDGAEKPKKMSAPKKLA